MVSLFSRYFRKNPIFTKISCLAHIIFCHFLSVVFLRSCCFSYALCSKFLFSAVIDLFAAEKEVNTAKNSLSDLVAETACSENVKETRDHHGNVLKWL